VIVVRTSFRGAPRRVIFNASSTASLGRVCARDGDVGSNSRLDDVLAFADIQAVNAEEFAQTHLLPHRRRLPGKALSKLFFLQLMEYARNPTAKPAESENRRRQS
jgi:hypothetical protein